MDFSLSKIKFIDILCFETFLVGWQSDYAYSAEPHCFKVLFKVIKSRILE